MPTKTATILIAIYKAGQYIEAKIKNLKQQTYFDRCNIVLLNCQNLDNEATVYADFLAENPNVMEISYDKHTRLYPTWNDGIKTTESTYIMNSNVDDMLHPQYVEACSKWLDENQDYCCVTTGILLTHKPNQLWPNWDWKDRLPFRVYPTSTAGPCPLWRRSLHDKYGFFGNYRVIGDAKMWEKWLAGGEKFGMLKRDFVLYYAHSGSLERRTDTKGQSFRDLDLIDMEKCENNKK